MTESLTYWLALKSIPGVGNRLCLQLIKQFGGPERVFEASPKDLLDIGGISGPLAETIARYKVPEEVKEDLALVQKKGFRIVTFPDADYPP
ncbi:MAG: DNA-protecting protein DprA, partial [Thermodesulfobacteriota bacterium]|nr:DNA-protecting protein DprA [Thermodesulfobacteriota bacterium]